MMVYMSKRMIACDEASYLISLREEKKLGFSARWKLKMHLLTCHICRKYARQIEEMQRTMKKYRDACSQESCSHHLPDGAGARMEKELGRELNAK